MLIMCNSVRRLLSEPEAGGPTSVSKQSVSPPQHLPHSDSLAYSALARGGCAAFPTCRSSHLPVRTKKKTNMKYQQIKKTQPKEHKRKTTEQQSASMI